MVVKSTSSICQLLDKKRLSLCREIILVKENDAKPSKSEKLSNERAIRPLLSQAPR